MAQYEGDFLRTNSRKRTQLLLRASDIELIRFYGYGNETTAERDEEFYRSGQRQYLFQPGSASASRTSTGGSAPP
jgi:hypothetical protein